MISQNLAYLLAEPSGLLLLDLASTTNQTLPYTYQTVGPSLSNTPPIAFQNGSTSVNLQTALQSIGVLIPPGLSPADTMAANYVVFYSGTSAFQGPQGPAGPAPTDSQIEADVGVYLASPAGTALIDPLVQSAAQAWLAQNQASLVGPAGPQGSSGAQGPPPTDAQLLADIQTWASSSIGSSALAIAAGGYLAANASMFRGVPGDQWKQRSCRSPGTPRSSYCKYSHRAMHLSSLFL